MIWILSSRLWKSYLAINSVSEWRRKTLAFKTNFSPQNYHQEWVEWLCFLLVCFAFFCGGAYMFRANVHGWDLGKVHKLNSETALSSVWYCLLTLRYVYTYMVGYLKIHRHKKWKYARSFLLYNSNGNTLNPVLLSYELFCTHIHSRCFFCVPSCFVYLAMIDITFVNPYGFANYHCQSQLLFSLDSSPRQRIVWHLMWIINSFRAMC